MCIYYIWNQKRHRLYMAAAVECYKDTDQICHLITRMISEIIYIWMDFRVGLSEIIIINKGYWGEADCHDGRSDSTEQTWGYSHSYQYLHYDGEILNQIWTVKCDLDSGIQSWYQRLHSIEDRVFHGKGSFNSPLLSIMSHKS